jgi:hypothetical protein
VQNKDEPARSITPSTSVAPVRALSRSDVARLATNDPAVEELRFKFFRQATPKIGAVSEALAAFLESRF